jgi:hypothetical protein
MRRGFAFAATPSRRGRPLTTSGPRPRGGGSAGAAASQAIGPSSLSVVHGAGEQRAGEAQLHHRLNRARFGVATRGSGELPRNPSAHPGECGCGQALYETARTLPDQAIGERPTVTRLHISSRPRRHATTPSERERRSSARTQHRNHEHATPLRRCGSLVLTVRSDEPHEERAAMSWYSRPRQCGEVALQERAVIRGPEAYHPRGPIQAETPVNTGLSQPVYLQATDRPQGCAHPSRASPSRPRTFGSTAGEGSSTFLTVVVITCGLGYPPKSPCRPGSNSGLGRRKDLQNRPFQIPLGIAALCT